MKVTSLPVLAAAVAVAGAAWAPGAAAQNYGTQQNPQMQQQQMSVSDTDLQSFAEAMQAVQQISRDYRPQMESADSAEAQQSIRREATEEMVSAIQETGLTVKQYNAINTAARNDPEIANKIRDLMQ